MVQMILWANVMGFEEFSTDTRMFIPAYPCSPPTLFSHFCSHQKVISNFIIHIENLKLAYWCWFYGVVKWVRIIGRRDHCSCSSTDSIPPFRLITDMCVSRFKSKNPFFQSILTFTTLCHATCNCLTSWHTWLLHIHHSTSAHATQDFLYIM